MIDVAALRFGESSQNHAKYVENLIFCDFLGEITNIECLI